ncbi:peptide deformylase, partial [Rhizobium ruizarguesonis]
MPLRPILRSPHPGLNNVCAPVTAFDSSLTALADELLATMRAAPGVGSTAAHIGVFNRVTVLELDQADGGRLYVNPQITWCSKETRSHTEG